MRSFETRGPVYPEDNYVVARTDELSDFINRLEKGRYVVLFAPRQTGKTTFFHRALDTLPADAYFPIQIDFQSSNNLEPAEFYEGLYEDICDEIEGVFQRRGSSSSAALREFLDNRKITNHLSMRRFFRRFSNFHTTDFSIKINAFYTLLIRSKYAVDGRDVLSADNANLVGFCH